MGECLVKVSEGGDRRRAKVGKIGETIGHNIQTVNLFVRSLFEILNGGRSVEFGIVSVVFLWINGFVRQHYI